VQRRAVSSLKSAVILCQTATLREKDTSNHASAGSVTNQAFSNMMSGTQELKANHHNLRKPGCLIALQLFPHKHYLISIGKRVTLIITEVESTTLPGCTLIGEIIKMKFILHQFIFGDGRFPGEIHFLKKCLVFLEDTVHSPDGVVGGCPLFVVKSITALIAAKFLICPSMQHITALEALTFRYHRVCVLWCKI
jgi:hypothetical protein